MGKSPEKIPTLVQLVVITLKGYAMHKQLAILILAAVGSTAWATPGGLDAKGCHDSQKIGYHCHPKRSAKATDNAQSLTNRERALKRECKGAVNAGVCAGYTR